MKTALIVSAVATAAVAHATPSEPANPFPKQLVFNIMKGWAEGTLAGSDKEPIHSEYPYFNFLPMHQASAIPGQAGGVWSAPCFQSNVATYADGVVDVQASNPSSDGCQDDYMFLSATGLQIVSINNEGKTSVEWTLPEDMRDAEQWDLDTKGVRVMRFIKPLHECAANVLQTLKLFVPEFTQQVDPLSAAANVEFMAQYPKFVMEKRDPLSGLPPPEHMVHSGDFFGIIRLDGLDPMLAWGMGSTTGHTTTALWIDGELFICESTVVDSYWPTDGIQKTPYKQWLKQAEEAGYNVVHVPLSKKYRALFDEQKALDFFNSVEGFEYGYKTMLWGWIDTIKDNYPCVPDDYSSVCLQWELIEPLFAVIDRYIPEISSMMYNDAWNKRIGQTSLRTAEIYKAAAEMGIESSVIPTIPEQDSWMYNTTRFGEPAEGPAMVCCVFVCNMVS